MKIAYLSLGSNMGDRESHLSQALADLDEAVEIVKVSSLYETLPWGEMNQDNFYNIVVEIKTNLPPTDLLRLCQKIENNHGRERKEKWGPRTIDIDILLYGEDKVSKLDLQIPHPYMNDRDFVIIPLTEINPQIELNGVKMTELRKKFDKEKLTQITPRNNWNWGKKR